MFRSIGLALLASIVSFAHPVTAQDRETIGYGRLFNNDYFGDNQDRWHTTSYTHSIVRAPEWTGSLPQGFGELLEYRLRGEIIAPTDLGVMNAGDRPYVGAATFGLHTHLAPAKYDLRFGVDATVVGPQTGFSELHDSFHKMFSHPSVNQTVKDAQLPNAVYLTASGEASRTIPLGEVARVRPFAEAQVGVETLARVGVDLFFGPVGADEMLIRDSTTGQLYRATENGQIGLSAVFGADYAWVESSKYIPSTYGITALDRYRLRARAHWQISQDMSFFYGLTYLSEEYSGQPEGQLIGSLKLNFNF